MFEEGQGLKFDCNHLTDGFGNHGHDICLMKVVLPDDSVRIFVVKNSKKEACLKESGALKRLNSEEYRKKGIRSVRYAGSAASASPDTFLVFTELEQGVKSLKAMIRDSLAAKKFNPKDLLPALGKWVALLHNNSVHHGDLRAQNILFSNNSSVDRPNFEIMDNFVVVDCEKSEIPLEGLADLVRVQEIVHLINDLIGIGVGRVFLKDDFLDSYVSFSEKKINTEAIKGFLESNEPYIKVKKVLEEIRGQLRRKMKEALRERI